MSILLYSERRLCLLQTHNFIPNKKKTQLRKKFFSFVLVDEKKTWVHNELRFLV